MLVSEKRRETLIAYGLGFAGLAEGLVRVFALEPLAAAIRERREATSQAAPHIGQAAVTPNVISLPAFQQAEVQAGVHERIAA